MPPSTLGEFEVLVLLAVLRLGSDAYPPAVRADIERRTARDTSRGAVYVTLDRLETKRLVESRLLAAGPAGARARRTYAITPRGLKAVRGALAAVDGMRSGLEAMLEKS
ncbi:MAG: helix-turn-helix transcriptional regulator [Vicinamibacterales bacterium]